MRRAALLILLACSPNHAIAQSHPGFTATTSKTPDQWGMYTVTLKNTSHSNITAAHFFLTCSDPQSSGEPSGTGGFDTLEQPPAKFITPASLAGIAPNTSTDSDITGINSHCSATVSVLFADGHGEGSDDPRFGWHAMLRGRIAYHSELEKTVQAIREIPASPDFSAQLLDRLDNRRHQLANRRDSGMSEEEDSARTQVLNYLLLSLRIPGHAHDNLTNPEAALKYIADWSRPLDNYLIQHSK